MTPDEIVSHVPSITLADVHASLAYYFDHIEEIQEEMRAERALANAARSCQAVQAPKQPAPTTTTSQVLGLVPVTASPKAAVSRPRRMSGKAPIAPKKLRRSLRSGARLRDMRA
jgi:hypothetical protein